MPDSEQLSGIEFLSFPGISDPFILQEDKHQDQPNYTACQIKQAKQAVSTDQIRMFAQLNTDGKNQHL